MEQIKKEKEFQIDKLIKLLSSSSKDFIVISAVPIDKSNSIISSIINICVDNKKYIPNWTSIGSINMNDCVNDIKNVILNNLDDNLLKVNNESFYKRRILAPRIRNRIQKLYKYKINRNEEDIKNTKNIIWPILTTISSFGVALGVPMFSTLLLRQDEIINGGADNKGALGEPFFISFLAIAVSFIIASILAMFISLGNTIRQYRKEYVSTLSYVEFNKIINKYFISINEKNEKLKSKKFIFREKYIFFYTSLDTTNPNYTEYLQLLNILTKMNCQCVLVFNEKITEEKQKSVFKGIIQEPRLEIISFDKYKNSANVKSLMNLILYQITLTTGISSRILIKNHSLFTNALYRFVDLSNSNEQLLRLLETLKMIVGNNKNIKIEQKYIPYFVHLFIISIIRSLDLALYEKIYYDLTTTGILSNETLESNISQFLRLSDVFNKSIIIYNEYSLFFEFNNFFNEIQSLRELIVQRENSVYEPLTKEEWINEIMELFKEKGCEQGENQYPDIFDLSIETTTNDLIYIKRIVEISKSETMMQQVKNLLITAKQLSIEYLLLDIFNNRLTYQLIDNKFELITDILL